MNLEVPIWLRRVPKREKRDPVGGKLSNTHSQHVHMHIHRYT